MPSSAHPPALNPHLLALVSQASNPATAQALMESLEIPDLFRYHEPGLVTRAELAQAMNMLLLWQAMHQVDAAKAYLADVRAAGQRVVFDHGALRTVRWAHVGQLPPGEAAFTRILKPLGYRLNKKYPLDKLGMTGRSYTHADAPADMAQYFVSELHPERFSPEFQEAVTRVLSTSQDPLPPRAMGWLSELDRDGHLPEAAAHELLPLLVGCFARQHTPPHWSDYEALLHESAEMAWIATEGNTFNHATDRVADVMALSEEQKRLGRPIKDAVEVSKTKRVLQTAYRAQMVMRPFVDEQGQLIERPVPGSFHEFITRHHYFDTTTHQWVLDLAFDAGNAQQIFKMTQAPA